jgi:2OG-Fe(II) oxygenase superfamily
MQNNYTTCDLSVAGDKFATKLLNLPVKEIRKLVESSKDSAVTNFGYSAAGFAEINYNFRRSWDFHESVVPEQIWRILEEEAKQLANANFSNCTELKLHSRVVTLYHPAGGIIGLHADAANRVNGAWVPSALAARKITALYYLTTKDLDHTGAELVFEFKEQSYNPKAGELLVFPSNPEWAHRVPANFGTRIVLGVFLQ